MSKIEAPNPPLLWHGDELVDATGQIVATLKKLDSGLWEPSAFGRKSRGVARREDAVSLIEAELWFRGWQLLPPESGQKGYTLMKQAKA
jgi:hypothetical protein